ncbi:MAG TPA: beta-ketoacyl synthase N-terminal-like domain-containing protein, partial [Symbiobacteriaceae bacterium]|nr:beta-ketoacyl synthase N-terminal-like domain-containing protein [Symbiobacteriaceae bacterium]
RGEVDMALAGGFDDAVSWWAMTKLEALRVMSERNDLGAAAYRPFDCERSGTLVGEGAAFFVLEEFETASRRGARIYAELTGFGTGYDAYKVMTPQPEGRGLAVAMQSALRQAGTAVDDVQYIAAHGSGTKQGDSSETAAIRTVFGPASDRLAASSVKPASGHLVGGAGALNAAVAALAIHHQTLPPTLNLRNIDPACRLDWVPGQARTAQVGQALAVARGLEGQNVVLSMRRV